MVSATRLMSWRTERSRSGVPTVPRKYFCTTTLVAVCVQPLGTSTSCCSKTALPFSPVMAAVRSSHWTLVKPSSPGLVKKRRTVRPGRLRALTGSLHVSD